MRYEEHVGQEIRMQVGGKVKLRRSGRGKPVLEATHKHCVNRETGNETKVVEVVDRESDRWYHHVEETATGKVVHHDDEPLSQKRKTPQRKPFWQP